MWTKTEPSFFARFVHSNRLSMHFRDAPAGAIGLFLIVFGVTLLPLAATLGEQESSIRRVLTVVCLLLPPAILSAIYSLFFEHSKLYGALDIALAGIVFLVQPITWYWLGLYLTTVCAFIVLCLLVWALKCRLRR